MAESYSIHISELPDELIFYIFSYLDEKEKIICSEVCHHWYTVVNNDYNWSKLLLNDVGILNISKITSHYELNECRYLHNRAIIKAAIWDPSVISKTMFTMCSPKIVAIKRHSKYLRENQYEQPSLMSKVKTLLWNNPKQEALQWDSSRLEMLPKWLIFGPGLETLGISIIAQKILRGHSSLFQVVKMISGGIAVIKCEGQLVRITFLYSNTKALRRPLPAQERLSSSKLFTNMSGVWVPSEPAKAACLGSNCIVYVIDATSEIENIDDPFPDLTLIIQETYQHHQCKDSVNDDSLLNCPLCLLVLACIPNEDSPKPNWQQLLQGLNLWKYTIPWQVCLITASNMANICIPLNWSLSRTGHL